MTEPENPLGTPINVEFVPPDYEPGEWVCYLFGSSKGCGLALTPHKGREPNRFQRWLQFVFFCNRWERRP